MCWHRTIALMSTSRDPCVHRPCRLGAAEVVEHGDTIYVSGQLSMEGALVYISAIAAH